MAARHWPSTLARILLGAIRLSLSMKSEKTSLSFITAPNRAVRNKADALIPFARLTKIDPFD